VFKQLTADFRPYEAPPVILNVDFMKQFKCHNSSHPRRMASCGMLYCVALVRTDVKEELSAFIRVARIGELGTTLVMATYLVHRFLSS
jgi:hypothetical protein